MDLKRLRYFCVIVEQGSISKAAQVLCMAQPPLSKRLQELEEEVGTELIIRAGRRWEPTEAGQYLYQRACEILRSVEDTKQNIVALANTERRILKVGVSYLFLHYFFPLIQQLYKQNPRAEISVSVSDSSHLEPLLQRGHIDIAFIQRPHAPEGFEMIDFPPVGLKALVSTTLLPAQPTGPVRIEEIGHHPLILLRRVEGPGTFETILDQLRKSGIHPDVKMHVSDPAIAIEMLESGIAAVVFLPESEAMASRSGQYICVDIFPSPLIFTPVAARLATGIDMPEIREIISDFIR